ncbi:unnamed protein product [Adineta ricciae]|uniref:Uncharacterized protein n=1 Tax=Adineta ricciae TaxID=249248 RepID=A0A815LU94_ADIRI|nr:unnamed protein product [Adineta ricciae]CAF1407743.1 unnamed protein product [Adineta ricciae]
MEPFLLGSSQSHEKPDIYDEISTQLDEIRRQSPDNLPVPVHVLKTALETADGQIEERFLEAHKCHSGQRIILIPYLINIDHWAGILLEWNSAGQIEQSKFIDPLVGSDTVPDELQNKFMKIFPKNVLRSKKMSKHEDQARSGMLTVTNLLNAVQKSHSSQASTFSLSSTNEEASTTSCEGNQKNLSELEKRLKSGLTKFKISDVNILSDRILKMKTRIEEYRETERMDDAGKEINYLKECEILAEIAEKIERMKANHSESDFEHQLADGLSRLKITDVKVLPERIARSEARIKEYQEEERADEAKNEATRLNELKRLQKLAEDIENLKTMSGQNQQSKLNRLEQQFATDLANLKIADPAKLSEKIAKSEERIKEFEEEDRIGDVEREKQYLNKCKALQKLFEEISQLKSNSNEAEGDDDLQKKLNDGLSKYKISNVGDLPERIHRCEQRIKDYQEEGHLEEAENENNRLTELKKLQKLADDLNKSKEEETDESKLRKLEEKLAKGLAQLKVPNVSVLIEKIQRSKQRISEFEEEDRIDEVEIEKVYLKNLEDLNQLADEITNLKSNSSKKPADDMPKPSLVAPDVENIPAPTTEQSVEKQRFNSRDMYPCAEKTIVEFLEYFQEKNLEGAHVKLDRKFINERFKQLQKQIEKQELFSKKIQENLQDLQRYTRSHDNPLILRCLTEILSQIRPLNVREIERLVDKAKDAAKLIAGKDIILLVGETGTGKSTTIQFLSGSKMKKTKVEVEPGRFLEHITIDGPIKNHDLINVTNSALSRSETRYIAPVTIPLRDIYGSHESGEIILCDAPGFGDTAGPEVDIANGVGVIEALKDCKTVKILALSSYKSLGDRGQGIQKLAHHLINMIQDIQERLGAICYAFTKYPSSVDINALLSDIKISKVDKDPLLQSDSTFVAVLKDMINKTRVDAEILDPLSGDPKSLIKKLRQLRGIKHLDEVFRFSISTETQSCISDQVQQDNSNIKCALKHRDIDLALYCLDKLKSLKDLIDLNTIRDSYEDAIRSVKETLTNFCSERTKTFHRSLVSQDGMKDEDIQEYKYSIEFIQKCQKLQKHFDEEIFSSELFVQNMINEIQERKKVLLEEQLSSHLIGIFFNNVFLLKNSFEQIQPLYKQICEYFQQEFQKLTNTTDELIRANQFDQIANVILQITKCLPTLNKHLNGLVEKKYRQTIQLLVESLKNILEKCQLVLAKPRLSENELEFVKNSVVTLGSVKRNAALQDRLSTYNEMFKKSENLNGIYNSLIEKIVEYFNEINNRIDQLFKNHGDRALEDTETLISDLDAIRTIPEIDSKTAGIYHQTVNFVRSQMNQIQQEVEDLLNSLESQKGTPNYVKIARLLSRMNNAKWMNRTCPGSYDRARKRITDELTEYFHDLEDRLMKLDLTMKHPENIPFAQEIFDKLDSLSIFDRILPELKHKKDSMIKSFLESVQANFDQMQKIFQLQDKRIYEAKQELIRLEQIEQGWVDLHPANVLLRQNNFSDFNKLEKEIKELENNRDKEIQHQNQRKANIEDKLTKCKEEEKSNFENRLAIQADTIQDSENKYKNLLEPLLSIKTQYESLIITHNTLTEEQSKYLQRRNVANIQILTQTIDEKKKIVSQHQSDQQTFHFDHFNAATADIALVYTRNCEKIRNICFKQMASETHRILLKYITEYGICLQKDIERIFKSILENNSCDSENLETRLEDLVALREYKNVFESIEGNKKVETWRRKFGEQYQISSTRIENYKTSGSYEDLHKELIVVQHLSRVDNFCSGTFLTQGFGALYRTNQIETSKQSKQTYENVLQFIKDENYAAIDNVMDDFDEKTANPRNMRAIKRDLQRSLDDLMKNTLKIANKLNVSDDFVTMTQCQIEKIIANFEKLRTVRRSKLLTLIDGEETKTDLNEFEKKLTDCLSKNLSQSIENIEKLLDSNDVFEVELSIEKFDLIRREFDQLLNLESIDPKLKEIKGKLDNLDQLILEQNDYLKDIQQYPIHSPKDLVLKLQKAPERLKTKYDKIIRRIIAQIKQNFQSMIDNVDKEPIEKRVELIKPLFDALDFLPDDLQTYFKTEVTQLKDKVIEENRTYKRELENFLKSEKINDDTIRRLNRFAEIYESRKQDELLTILHSGVSNKLDHYWNLVQQSFEKEEIQLGLENIPIILKFHLYAPNIPVSERYLKLVSDLLSGKILLYSKALSDVFSLNKLESVDKALQNLILCLDFVHSYSPQINDFIPEKTFTNTSLSLNKLSTDWQVLVDNFNTALKAMNISVIKELLHTASSINQVLKKFHCCACEHSMMKSFLIQMKQIPEHNKLMKSFQEEIRLSALVFQEDLISDRTERFEADREQFFSKLSATLKVFQLIEKEFSNKFASIFVFEQIEKDLKMKVEKIKEKLVSSSNQTSPTSADADQFRLYYNHLLSIEKHLQYSDLQIRQTLELAEKSILRQVD